MDCKRNGLNLIRQEHEVTNCPFRGWTSHRYHQGKLGAQTLISLCYQHTPKGGTNSVNELLAKFHFARMTCTFIVYFVFSSSSKRQRSPSRNLLSRANCFHPFISLLTLFLSFLITHRTSQLLPRHRSISVWSSNGRYTSAYTLGMF